MNLEGIIAGPKNEKSENVFEMETPSAIYDIVYSNHEIPADPATVAKADAIVLEGIGDYNTPDNAIKMIRFILSNNQYREICKSAETKKQPIFLVDLSFKFNEEILTDIYTKEFFMTNSEAVSGGAALLGSGIYLGKKMAKEKEISRRDFLKSVAGAAVGSYLLTPKIKTTSLRMSYNDQTQNTVEDSLSRKLNKKMESLNFYIHPELSGVTFDTRNDLIAQKSETIGRIMSERLKRKPRIGLMVGSSHSGIERSLDKKGSERISSLKKSLGEDFKGEKTITMVEFLDRQEKEKQLIKFTIFSDPSFEDVKK